MEMGVRAVSPRDLTLDDGTHSLLIDQSMTILSLLRSSSIMKLSPVF